MILAGDVGGTKAVLALFEPRGDALVSVRETRYATAEYEGLEAVAEEFLGGAPGAIDRACFGVAGPVIGETIELTNAGWRLERSQLKRVLGIERVAFLNDLEATAYGIDALPPERLATLAPGEPHGKTAALIAAGTGLGMAVLTELDGRVHVLASEGGHADFAPREPDQVALFEWLRARHGHVSVERIVSGPGIRTVYRFLVETGRVEERAGAAERIARSEDPSAAISEAAIDGDPAASAAIDLFVACYGAAAGNLALTTLALRGLYIGGGIAPSILPLLGRDDRFVRAFRAKGRLEGLLSEVPVRVILEPRAALLGAARYASLV